MSTDKPKKPMSFDEAMAAGLDPWAGELIPMVVPNHPRAAQTAVVDVVDDAPPIDEDEWRHATTELGRPAIAMETLSDTGNAERWARMFKEDFRFDSSTKTWMSWDGRRWDRNGNAQTLLSTKEVARSFLIDAARTDDKEKRKTLAGHADYSESASGRKRMLDLAIAEPGVSVAVEQLDANPWLLNCANGTVNLMTGALNPFRREDLCTRMSPVIYDRDAKCPVFDAFLESSLPDKEVRDWLMRFLGYCLTGVVREHIFPVLWGAVGRNGKGTLIETVFSILGELATPVPNELIVETKQEQHPTIKAQLLGVRFAVGAELKPSDKLNEGMVKHLTGGDTIRARFMRQDLFSFRPTHKLLLQTNHRPRATADAALWSRVRVVPFTVSFAGREDLELKDKLAKEREGILARLVRSCLEWQHSGLGTAQAIEDATAAYAADSDTMGMFLAECTERTSDGFVRASDLYHRYQAWSSSRGERPWTNTSFGTSMVSRGLKRGETKAGRVYRDLKMREVEAPHVEATTPDDGLEGSLFRDGEV